MIDFKKLNKENTLIALAVQSCTGAISPNMRMISFSVPAHDEDQDINMFFILADDLAEDREEAQDIADEFSILTENFRVEAHIEVVGNAHIPLPEDGSLVIFKQRES